MKGCSSTAHLLCGPCVLLCCHLVVPYVTPLSVEKFEKGTDTAKVTDQLLKGVTCFPF